MDFLRKSFMINDFLTNSFFENMPFLPFDSCFDSNLVCKDIFTRFKMINMYIFVIKSFIRVEARVIKTD